MLINELKRPFQYKKINIDDLTHHRKKKAKNTAGTIKRIWSYLADYKGKLFLVILMVLASTVLGLLGPYLIGTAIDKYIVTKESTGLVPLLIVLIFIYLFNSLAIFLQNFWMVDIAQNVVYRLRKELFQQFHLLSISFFDERQDGELMSRVTNDSDNINNSLNQSVIQIFSSVLTLIGTVAVMLFLSPLLTVVTLTIIPVLFLAMRWITRRTGPLYKLQQRDLGELNGYIEETISGQQVIQTYSQEKRVIKEFAEKNASLKTSGFWALTIAGFIPKVMNTLNYVSFGLIALVGGILAIKGYVTVGIIVIFTEYARQFTRPLNELSNQYNILLSAIAGAERVFSIIDEEQESTDETEAIDLLSTNGHFLFNNVSFGYDEELILKKISFEAKPGEKIAFVGHTGAGKTTIINLISRFYNYSGGTIQLDGVELNKIKRSSLRSHIAFVLQDSFLFHNTIRENIRYGKLNATNEEVEQAAKKANAHEFIVELPNGYDTVLDESGRGISQGQKQLLAIARAFISERSILILDEATSNIDTITEMKIQQALEQLMQNRTSFIIAHRLNTIQRADKIILLENGEIKEQGTHQELFQKKGKYFGLYQEQLKQG